VRNRIASLFVVLLVGAAAIFAWFGIGDDRRSSAGAPDMAERPSIRAERSEPPNDPPIGNGSPLPPDHPPIGNEALSPGMGLPPNHPPLGPDAPRSPGVAVSDEPSALDWKKPGDWQQVPNPSALRLATYRVPGGAEMSVARAGGSTEANIQRWLSQFDNAGADTREERTIRGLHVTLVQVAGTYEPSPMMAAAAPPEAHPAWALQGAIVETSGSPYFFKLIGPVLAIKSARPSFESLVASLTPR
jgi:hypothetical protein